MHKKPHGFLLIGALVLVIIMGALAVYVGHVASTTTNTNALYRDQLDATSLANSALEHVSHQLVSSNLNDRITCKSLVGNTTAQTLDHGQYKASATWYYSSNPATLPNEITDTQTIIPMSTLSGYAPKGRVRIDHEFIDYTGTANTAAACNEQAPCLTGAKRARAGSTASAHDINTPVGQNQCGLIITAAIPTFSSVIAQHTLHAQMLSLDEGWLVSRQPRSRLAIFRFTGAGFTEYMSGDYDTNLKPKHTNTVAQVSYPDVRFGLNRDSKANFVTWTGSILTRTLAAVGAPSDSILSISCPTSLYCWATSANGNLFVYDQNTYGSTWQSARYRELVTVFRKDDGTYVDKDYGIPVTSRRNSIDVELHSISCTSKTNCWAVGTPFDENTDEPGEPDATQPLYEHWDGTTWRRASDPIGTSGTGPAKLDNNLLNADLNGVYCLANGTCWSVGDQRSGHTNINHFDGTTWSRVTVDINRNLNAVFCNAANDCWAVGQSGGSGSFRGSSTIAHYDGSNWTRQTLPDDTPNQTLESIMCANANNCWASGNNGTLLHYDGKTWAQVAVPDGVSSMKLNDFSIISVANQLPAFIQDS